MLNIEGNPVFLRAEITEDNELVIPPFFEVIKDVTSKEYFTSKNMARKNFKFDYNGDINQDQGEE